MDPSKRFITLVLAAGVAVLLAAILIGEQMGSRVLVAAANANGPTQAIVTPVPSSSGGPFGPDWKRSQTLAAPVDPGFPDPRVPPRPLPTPQMTPRPKPTVTVNPNLPIWDQTPIPTGEPSATPGRTVAPGAVPTPEATP
jgi:hypothetical protein